jgi:hypothetical protein
MGRRTHQSIFVDRKDRAVSSATRRQKDIDPKRVFMQGQQFHNFVNFANASTTANSIMVAMFAPVAVSAAFAAELYLKCISCLEHQSIPHSHDLEVLYHRLSKAAKVRLDILWDIKLREGLPGHLDLADRLAGRKLRRDLPGVLAESARAFEQFRYLYEGRDDVSAQVSFLFPDVARNYILEIQPGWREINFKTEWLPVSTLQKADAQSTPSAGG